MTSTLLAVIAFALGLVGHGVKGAASAVAFTPPVDNREMSSIYNEDQSARVSPFIDWSKVSVEDAVHRAQVATLLASGALHTGKDFERAAFVYQHGDKPDDYLLAHTLAMVALSRGQSSAIWIATATLDRYLQAVGQKQIFGTQFTKLAPPHVTQEPFDRSLIADALRMDLHVPSLSDQDRQRAEIESRRQSLLPPSKMK